MWVMCSKNIPLIKICITAFPLAMIGAIGLSLAFGCNQRTDYEKEWGKLMKEEAILKCKMEAMRDSIFQSWDQLHQLMEANLPEGMPIEEKTNMLRLKNANLIRMFESYRDLDMDIKNSLASLEKHDRQISDRVVKLKKKTEIITEEKLELLAHMSTTERKKIAIESKKNEHRQSIKCD